MITGTSSEVTASSSSSGGQERCCLLQGGAAPVSRTVRWTESDTELRSWLFGFATRFASKRAEQSYRHYSYHQHGFEGPALALLLVVLAVPFLIRSESYVSLAGCAVLFFTNAISLAIAINFRRSATVNTSAAQRRMYVGEVLQITGLLLYVFALFANAAVTQQDCLEDSKPAISVTEESYCKRQPRPGVIIVQLALFLAVRRPLPHLAMQVVHAGLQLRQRPLVYGSSGQHIATYGILLAVMVALLCGASAARHGYEQRHFVQVLRGVALEQVFAGHLTKLANIVQASMPRRVAMRMAVSSMSGLDAAADAHKSCVICLTTVDGFRAEACAVSAERHVYSLHVLFTLFDEGTQLYDVDPATVFGDTYVVSTGLLAESDASPARSVEFAQWQHRAAADMLLQPEHAKLSKLRTVAVLGEARSGLVGGKRYTVAGPAVDRGLALIDHVQAEHVWITAAAGPCTPDDLGDIFESPLAPCPEAEEHRCAAVAMSKVDGRPLPHPRRDRQRATSIGPDTKALALAARALRPARDDTSADLVAVTTDATPQRRTGTFVDPEVEEGFRAFALASVNRAFPVAMLVTGVVLTGLVAVSIMDRAEFGNTTDRDIASTVLQWMCVFICFASAGWYLWKKRRDDSEMGRSGSSRRTTSTYGLSIADPTTQRRAVVSHRFACGVNIVVVVLHAVAMGLLDNSILAMTRSMFFLVYAPFTTTVFTLPFCIPQSLGYGFAIGMLPVAVIVLMVDEYWYATLSLLVMAIVLLLMLRVGWSVRATFALAVQSQRTTALIKTNARYLTLLAAQLVPHHAVEAGMELLASPDLFLTDSDSEGSTVDGRGGGGSVSVFGRIRTIQSARRELAFISHRYANLVTAQITVLWPSATTTQHDPSGDAAVVDGGATTLSRLDPTVAFAARVWDAVFRTMGDCGEGAEFDAVQVIGDNLTVCGPLSPYLQTEPDGASVTASAVAVVAWFVELSAALRAQGVGFVATAVADDAIGALVGRRAMRYRVFGVSAVHSAALQSVLRGTCAPPLGGEDERDRRSAGVESSSLHHASLLPPHAAFVDRSVAVLVEPDAGLDVYHRYVHLGTFGALFPPGSITMYNGPSRFGQKCQWRLSKLGYRTMYPVRLTPVEDAPQAPVLQPFVYQGPPLVQPTQQQPGPTVPPAGVPATAHNAYVTAPPQQQPQPTYGTPYNQQPQLTYGTPDNQQPEPTCGTPDQQQEQQYHQPGLSVDVAPTLHHEQQHAQHFAAGGHQSHSIEAFDSLTAVAEGAGDGRENESAPFEDEAVQPADRLAAMPVVSSCHTAHSARPDEPAGEGLVPLHDPGTACAAPPVEEAALEDSGEATVLSGAHTPQEEQIDGDES